MKKRIPGKIIEVCDICERETAGCVLVRCIVCRKQYCITCEAIMVGCVHKPELCRECGRLDKVKAVIDRFVKPLLAVLDRRDKALARLRPTKK